MQKTNEEIENYLEDNLLSQFEIKEETELVQTREQLEKHVKENDGAIVDNKRGGVIVGKEGGVLTFLEGFKHPLKGWPANSTTTQIHIFKSLIPFVINFIHKKIKKKIPEPEQYSKATRAMYYWFTRTLIERENYYEMKLMWRKIRDIICVIMEYDMAYRLRLQDALPELPIENIKLDEGDKEFCDIKEDYTFGYQIEQKRSVRSK